MRRKSMAIITFMVFVILALGYYLYKNYSVYDNLGEFALSKKDKYDTSYEKKEALKKFNIDKKAEIIKNADVKDRVVALTFEGIKNREATEEILDLLDLYDVKATFIITGVEASEDQDLVKTIGEEGYDIGSGALSGEKEMQNLAKEDLVENFITTNKILKDITKKNIRLLKCKSTEYSDELLASAYVAGNKYVVEPNYYLSYQSFSDYKEASGYVKKLSNGDIISINLDGVLDEFEYGKINKEEKPAIDNQESLNEDNESIYGTTIVDVVEWILDALNEEGITPVEVKKLPIISKRFESDVKPDAIKENNTYIINNYYTTKILNKETNKEPSNTEIPNNYNTYIKNLITKNNKNTAPIITRFLTTQNSVSYTFRGLSNEIVLDNVLVELNKSNAKGTFFVTKDEIEDYPERIDKIIKAGHEIANGGITKDSKITNKSTEEICNEIYEVDKLLKDKGIYTNAYMPGYGYYNENIQEAVSTIKQINGLEGYELIKYTKSPIMDKYEDMSPSEIVNDYFDINYYFSLSKGEIVYFRLDSKLFNDKNKIANIIGILTDKYVKNGYVHKFNKETTDYEVVQIPLNYSVTSIKNIQDTKENVVGYGRYDMVLNFKSLEKVDNNKINELIKNNYIGNKDVILNDFNSEELLNIDKSGTINTNGEDVIFLTFDDWGGDPIINSILDVLDKHKVKASFFTIGKYIDLSSNVSNVNPNLLRTIALKGHDIGSHSYNHDLLNSNKEDLQWSLLESYNAMGSIVGDLKAFKKYFRPPTLYVTKEGLSTVFESGYKYSVSGNISTHDYEEESSDKIVKTIEGELVRGVGNIVIMHMNNQSYYTAEAIDKFLTNNENGVYGKKYRIAKLSDYLVD